VGKTLNSHKTARTVAGYRGGRAFFFHSLFRALRGFGSIVFLLASLALTSPAQDLENLSRAIADGSTEQKRDALFQIRNLRSEIASRAAVPALKDSDPMVRATAAASVVFLPKQEAVAVLTPLLEDRDAFVRKEGAYALGRVESPDAAASLIRILQRDKDLEVRAAAAVGLGQTGNPAAVEPLLSILQRRPSEETEFLRRSAARSIGQIAQIARTSDPYVVTPENFLPDKYKKTDGLRDTAAQPVIGGAVQVLSAVLQNRQESDDTRREAAFALGAIGNPSAVNILRSLQTSPDPYLAEISKEALLKIEAGNK
jgi:HEAT repeat protein